MGRDAAQLLHIVLVGHGLKLLVLSGGLHSGGLVASGDDLRHKELLAACGQLGLNLAEEPAAGVFLNDRHALHQHLVADVVQLAPMPPGGEAQGADHRGGGLLGEYGDGKHAALLNALAAVVLRVHGEGHQRRGGGRGFGHLHHRVDDAGAGALLAFDPNGVHAVCDISKNDWFHSSLLSWAGAGRGISRTGGTGRRCCPPVRAGLPSFLQSRPPCTGRCRRQFRPYRPPAGPGWLRRGCPAARRW